MKNITYNQLQYLIFKRVDNEIILYKSIVNNAMEKELDSLDYILFYKEKCLRNLKSLKDFLLFLSSESIIYGEELQNLCVKIHDSIKELDNIDYIMRLMFGK